MPDQEPSEKESERVPVQYNRAGQFRVIFGSGFVVGVTLVGELFVTVFSEHPSFPDRSILQFSKDGRLVNEAPATIEKEYGLQRELEASIIMSRQVAKSLIEAVQGQLNQMEAIDATRKTAAATAPAADATAPSAE